MEIRGVKGQFGPGQVVPGNPQKTQAGPAGVNWADGDNVQISPVARHLEQYSQLPSIRIDKVAQARQAIDSGQMDTDDKLSVAIDRLLDDLLSG